MTVDIEYTYVLYDCHGCGIERRRVMVPERTDMTVEGLHGWMNAARHRVGTDHHRISPDCTSVVCDLLIPMSGRDNLGGPAKH